MLLVLARRAHPNAAFRRHTIKRIILAALVGVLVSGPVSLAVAGFDEGVAAYERGDYATAVKEFRAVAEQGAPDAQYNLGFMYEDGTGVVQDYKEAVKWYRKAADRGHTSAQYNLGFMYDGGKGVVQDYKEAIKWYRTAAEQGHAKAQFKLGVMYGYGRGVIQDYVQAHTWFNIGAANGYEEAIKNRDIVEEVMTASDISKAKKLAQEWMAKHQK